MTARPVGRPLENFYGRRHGHKLRRRRSSLIEGLLPRLRLAQPEPGVALDPKAFFDRPVVDVWLEVGFGSGEHLAAQAAAHPAIGLIGCEPFVNGVASLLDRIDRGGLDNVRILDDDARPLIDALNPASIGRCFVLFGDPWPKRRHAERRFVGPATLGRLARILKDRAELRLASDDPILVSWMLEHAWRHPAFDWLARSGDDWRRRPADWPPTRYEEKAIAAGRRPVFLRFARRAREDGKRPRTG